MSKVKKADATPSNGVSATTEAKQRSLANLKMFQPGQSGNPAGRTKGTRHKLGEAFLQDMMEAWSESGKAAITKVIEDRPHEFIKTVASILPKEISVQAPAVQELSDDDLASALVALRSAIAATAARNGTETTARH
jgi:hypothetical protein